MVDEWRLVGAVGYRRLDDYFFQNNIENKQDNILFNVLTNFFCNCSAYDVPSRSLITKPWRTSNTKGSGGGGKAMFL